MSGLQFHRVDFVDLKCRPILKNSENNRKADRGFRCGDHHDEKGVDLTVNLFQSDTKKR